MSSRPRIAIIEADAAERRALCALLSSLNADIHDYESAESFLASPLNAPGCLITDVELPGMSGLDLLRRLRAEHIALPIILLGDEADVGSAVSAMREGAVDFIEKPQMQVAITRRVAHVLEHARSPHERLH